MIVESRSGILIQIELIEGKYLLCIFHIYNSYTSKYVHCNHPENKK